MPLTLANVVAPHRVRFGLAAFLAATPSPIAASGAVNLKRNGRILGIALPPAALAIDLDLGQDLISPFG